MTSKTCRRFGCGHTYDESTNTEGCCTYHTGWPLFRDITKTWTCCQASSYDWDDFMKIPGCSIGRHTDERIAKPIVQEQTNSAASGPLPLPVTNVDSKSLEVTELPVPPEQHKMIPLITPAGLYKCAHSACGKEYDPSDNSESSCSYHSGKAGFRDTRKFWACCNESSYDWDDFMKLPTCCTGPHEPKMIVDSNIMTDGSTQDRVAPPESSLEAHYSLPKDLCTSACHMDHLWCSKGVVVGTEDYASITERCLNSWSPGMVLNMHASITDESKLLEIVDVLEKTARQLGKARRVTFGSPPSADIVARFYNCFYCVEKVDTKGNTSMLGDDITE